MPYEPLDDDFRHDLVGVVPSLAPLVSQREHERCGEVFGRGGHELVGGARGMVDRGAPPWRGVRGPRVRRSRAICFSVYA
jgi:hypothetical protein